MEIKVIQLPPSRRGVLLGAGFALAASITPGRAQPPDLEGLAEDAAIWGLPLVETGRYLALARARGFKLNQFYLNQTLATPSLKIPGPNIDTIYGFAWLDLSAGPQVLDVPDAGDRYYVLQLMDVYENTFAYVGRRETGTRAGSYVIAGPGWSGQIPVGANRIDSPTNVVFVLTRTLVRGDRDLQAAQNLQSSYTLAPLSNYPAGKTPGIVQPDALNILPKLDLGGPAVQFFSELNALVKRYPPRGREAVQFSRFADLGLGGNFPKYPPVPPAALQSALERALHRVKSANITENNNGWRVNYGISKFIADPVARAAVDQFGPGANITEEALYFSATHDKTGAPLSGAHSYSITFARGQLPPVHAFWSLILYGADFFLVDNPINRYAITDRTAGLVFSPDGSLRIVIQHQAPASQANWLPAPAGAFQLILRTYQPYASLLARTYQMPAIVRIG